ncbi:lytic transglycosylase domain-containing protein [Solitalea lacus]|uniref:lytic transglycosylase domain-containing protein n=1 Tax=Solitalea lacus TaxID=2911172 RepID=UPI001EDC3C33|nr:lytic transglycosylase domain-containing protein [Solitalea lacus]UKJ08307.1 lytic transglycosylase domain-containing protein [Solitalea lacus]
MIRKHVIACASGVIVFALINFLFFNSNSGFSVNKEPLSTTPASTKATVQKSVDFAGEEIPLHDAWVKKRFIATLKQTKLTLRQVGNAKARAKRWFKVMEPILAKHGIPQDFKYIPVIESGYDFGSDTSRKGAAGFWQFMPSTARSYGLAVREGVDERYDPIKSTHAACRYLKDLYREFGSWTMVAAAYNIGSTKLQMHSKQQKEDDYFKLKLNKETSIYVYKLIAVKTAINRTPVNNAVQNKAPKTLTAGYTINLSNLYSYSPEFITDMLKHFGYSSLKNLEQKPAK